jgi:flagellar basal body-associated protein FliL
MVQQSSRRGGEMLKPACVLMITLALVFPLNEIAAGESKEQTTPGGPEGTTRKKKQRATEIAEATKSFQEFARNLKAETQEKVKELDVEFELKGREEKKKIQRR